MPPNFACVSWFWRLELLFFVHASVWQEGLTDLKNIAGDLSGLKNHMQTNKPLSDIQIDGTGDEELWNSYLEADRNLQQKEGRQCAWFVSPWLLTECYMYRRIMSAIRRRWARLFRMKKKIKKKIKSFLNDLLVAVLLESCRQQWRNSPFIFLSTVTPISCCIWNCEYLVV